MTDLVKRPEDRLEINFRGEPKELFMSYQRLNSAIRVLGDPNNIIHMMIDPDISENMLRVAVAPKGSPESMFEMELDDDDFSLDEADRVLIWVRDHITGFFARRLQQSQEFAKQLEPMMIALKSSLIGSAPSNSSGAAAGLSA
jgi:hypothetical protein